MTTLTTIKVPKALRDRITAQARAEGSTVAAHLTALLDEHERCRRLQAVGRAFARGLDDDYQADLATWDSIAAGSPSW